jgi:hypothetical protein
MVRSGILEELRDLFNSKRYFGSGSQIHKASDILSVWELFSEAPIGFILKARRRMSWRVFGETFHLVESL